MVQKVYKTSTLEVAAANFVFWIAYYFERQVREVMIETMAGISPRSLAGQINQSALDILLDNATFGTKLRIFKKTFLASGTRQGNEVLGFLEEIKRLRNAVAHGDFRDLNYKGKHLGEFDGQDLVIGDFSKILGIDDLGLPR